MTHKKVIEIIARELGIGEEGIELVTPLATLPMDSLEFIDIIQCLRKEVGEISDTALVDCHTVGDLVRAIA